MSQTERTFYAVTDDLNRAPLRDYMMHGYETRSKFETALRELAQRWHGRVGECVDERNGFLRLRFHDTPGGLPDEAWLPRYLLLPTAMPDYLAERENSVHDETEEELDRIFGFD